MVGRQDRGIRGTRRGIREVRRGEAWTQKEDWGGEGAWRGFSPEVSIGVVSVLVFVSAFMDFYGFPEKRFSVSEVKHVTWLFRILLRRFLKHTNEPLSSAHVGWHSRYSVLRLGDPPAGLLMTCGIALCGGGLRRLLSFW